MAILSIKFEALLPRTASLLAIPCLFVSCDITSSIDVATTKAATAGVKIIKIRPIEAKPSDIVTIEGSNFSSTKNLRVRFTASDTAPKDVSVTIKDSTKASFVMPEGVGLGLKQMKIILGTSTEVASLNLVANSAENQLPIMIADATTICSDVQYVDRNGDEQTGTKNCSGSQTSLCAADGASNCIVDGMNYKAAATANLSAGNIKNGVTVAGTIGQYPNSTYPLTGSSGTDLTAATFNAQIKSSAMFQYFTSDGTRNTGTGDTNLTAVNIAKDVTIFGSIGTYQGVAPDPWNVRVGTTVNGVVGKLKVSCRNRANPSIFDMDSGQSATITTGSPGSINITNHGLSNGTMVRLNYSAAPTGLLNDTTYYVVNAAADTFNLATSSGGSAINMTTSAGTNVSVHKWKSTPQSIDIWDTIDDYNNNGAGLPANTASSWPSDTDCGGVETAAGDANVWKDVTTTAAGATSNCATDSARCTMQDKITGLWWSKIQTNVDWNSAWNNCRNLNHNGQSGWRLPTQKELMEAYGHGIRSAVSTNWITQSGLNNWFWSGSSNSAASSNAWGVSLSTGYTLNTAITCGINAYVRKDYTNWHICVR